MVALPDRETLRICITV